MFQLAQIVVLALLAVTVYGSCPDVSLVKSFDTKKYMGTWYEIQAQDSSFRTVTSCGKSEYSLINNEVHVVTQGENNSGGQEKDKTKMSISEDPARMFTSVRALFITVNAPYEVLDTDYTSYSCVHFCLSYGIIGTYDYLWIYSRNRTPDRSKLNAYRSLFSQYSGTDVSTLKDTPQVGCWNLVIEKIFSTYSKSIIHFGWNLTVANMWFNE